ncbi:pyroglutamyl-peptidase I [Nocardioides limicola]|uniref:pyroglutamyl-peptidase I n=1 Tax=Nocardioides limicola TaxID=2803368 RepID=UPI00193B3481|nr:pyroglutamyl-peptidase I [Nocardioides sp. DJM-14]
MSTILLTGFEPFGGRTRNLSAEAVGLLGDTWSDPAIRLVTAVLPVEFAGSVAALAELVGEHRPDAVIAVGEGWGRTAITPETRAVNLDDARIPDNAGEQPRQRPIDPAGAPLRRTRLDVDLIVAACVADGLPAEPSHDAGRFVCNHLFHALLGLTDGPAGFVHVPAPELDGEEPTVPVTDLARALGHAVRVTALGCRP